MEVAKFFLHKAMSYFMQDSHGFIPSKYINEIPTVCDVFHHFISPSLIYLLESFHLKFKLFLTLFFITVENCVILMENTELCHGNY